MTRQKFVLAVLAAGNGVAHTPVQVQKLFFLLGRKRPEGIDDPWFNFQPHDYGPFDKAIFDDLRALAAKGLVGITSPTNGPHMHWATPTGLLQGQQLLSQFPAETAKYIRELSAWVRGQSFESLVSSIYQQFPLMSGGAVFRGPQ